MLDNLSAALSSGTLMFRFLAQRRKQTVRPAGIPPGLRVYVIGDIHGRLDLLSGLHHRIVEDARSMRGVARLIYLGDYIDRGPSSREVLEFLSSAHRDTIPATCLLGNHEAMLLRFLEDCSVGPEWFAYGGLATLMSYGIGVKGEGSTKQKLIRTQQALRQNLPARHNEFLLRLPTHVSLGDYYFVHAGVRPGIPLDLQKDTDLIWIREEFLASRDFHGKIVVHGHSYKTEPEVMPNRIGIDTGAYATGRLTCLVLEAEEMRFL
jgi:serine/threonine protein phosphatase 1